MSAWAETTLTLTNIEEGIPHSLHNFHNPPSPPYHMICYYHLPHYCTLPYFTNNAKGLLRTCSLAGHLRANPHFKSSGVKGDYNCIYIPTNLNIQNGYPAQPPPETSCQLAYSNRMIDDPVDEGAQGCFGTWGRVLLNKWGRHTNWDSNI